MNILEICNKYGISLDQLRSKSRKDEIVKKRKRICFELYRAGVPQTYIAPQLNLTQSGVSRLITSFTL